MNLFLKSSISNKLLLNQPCVAHDLVVITTIFVDVTDVRWCFSHKLYFIPYIWGVHEIKLIPSKSWNRTTLILFLPTCKEKNYKYYYKPWKSIGKMLHHFFFSNFRALCRFHCNVKYVLPYGSIHQKRQFCVFPS